jgi:hypothetical protein
MVSFDIKLYSNLHNTYCLHAFKNIIKTTYILPIFYKCLIFSPVEKVDEYYFRSVKFIPSPAASCICTFPER